MDKHKTASNQGTYGEVPPDEEGTLEPKTLIIEDEVLRKGFTSIPNYILEDTRVSLGARFTYVLLLSFAWKHGDCFPGQKRLGILMGIKERMVRYYLTELAQKGYIAVTRRGLNRTNVYHILRVRRSESEADRQQIAGQERQSISYPNRQQIAEKEYSVEKDSEEEYSDHSKFRKKKIPRKKESENEAKEISKLIGELSKNELQDPIHEKSNITQAYNLWQTSRSSEEEFIELIREARKRTLEHAGAIRKIALGGRGSKNRAPYFFQVLKRLTQETALANFRHGFKTPT